MRHREGDAPGPALDLLPEQLGSHGGLAVRGEREAVADGVRLHEREVVLQALGRQGEDGGREAAGEEVAALGGQLADGQAVGVRREALEAVVDAFPGESGEGFHTHEASLIRHVAMLAILVAYIAYRCLTSRPTRGQRSRRHPTQT